MEQEVRQTRGGPAIVNNTKILSAVVNGLIVSPGGSSKKLKFSPIYAYIVSAAAGRWKTSRRGIIAGNQPIVLLKVEFFGKCGSTAGGEIVS
jgi:hypothetical protein